MSTGSFVNSFNQFLAFSPVYAATAPAENIFWPGCAAMKLAPQVLIPAYRALQELLPSLGFSSWCCGKPTFALGTQNQAHRRQLQLAHHFAKAGIRRIFTLCPNCLATLGNHSDVEVCSAWPLLAHSARRNPLQANHFARLHILHDPCAAREDAASQAAARSILKARGVPYTEFAHCRAQTRCCGRKNMLFLTQPAAAQKLRDARLAETQDLPVVTYCESCVEAFQSAHHPAVHLLEVLFDHPSTRGVANRFFNAHRKDFHA